MDNERPFNSTPHVQNKLQLLKQEVQSLALRKEDKAENFSCNKGLRSLFRHEVLA